MNMRPPTIRSCLVGLIVALDPTMTTRGEDNSRLVVDGISTNIEAHLTVGANGTNNTLVIQRGGRLRCLRGATVGDGREAWGNTSRVLGARSLWQVEGGLQVGWTASSSNAIIADAGAVVWASWVQVGRLGPGGAMPVGNGVTVSQLGTRWIVEGAYTMSGRSGRTRVDGGAALLASSLEMRGSAETIELDGFGSLISTELFEVGWDSVGNKVIVSNGGLLQCGEMRVGGEYHSLRNTVSVTGAGTVLRIAHRLRLAGWGAGQTRLKRGMARISSVAGAQSVPGVQTGLLLQATGHGGIPVTC